MALVIFDLDGTLLNTAPDIYAAASSFMADHQFAKPTFNEVKSLIGGGVRNMLRQLLKIQDASHLDDKFEQQLADFTKRYESTTSMTAPYEGCIEALDALILKGHRLGICTNKPTVMAAELLRGLGMNDRFQVIVGPEHVVARKPDPRHLQTVCEMMGGGTSVFVGDSAIDAETAERASVPFIFFQGGYLQPSTGQKLFQTAAFEDYRQLPTILANVIAGILPPAPAFNPDLRS